ncbi:hypothetical protein QQP08_001925, partial [Theobroma cacao]
LPISTSRTPKQHITEKILIQFKPYLARDNGFFCLDIKVWFATEEENWEVLYTQTKPVLFCSCNDNTVRLYDLPSFTERGRLYSKREVRVIHRGPFPLFFTGYGSG